MKLLLTALLFTFCGQLFSQQHFVTYERTFTFKIRMGAAEEGAEETTRTRRSYFDLHINGNESLYKESDREDMNDMANEGGGMMMMRSGGNLVTYINLNDKTKTEKSELAEKEYIVIDTITKGDWKFFEDTKTILGHVCKKATTKVPSQRNNVRFFMGGGGRDRNGADSTAANTAPRKDSVEMIVWYATDIALATGPTMQGQLPGLILEIDNDGTGVNVITAISITDKPKLNLIKAPTKGKKVTREELNKKRDDIRKQMIENMRSGGGPVRITSGG
jgi:GLPGLI family protein